MERIKLPLSELTFSQKLDLLETIWNDLSMNEKILESPVWHQAVLKDRKKALALGKATVSDWKEAKVRINDEILSRVLSNNKQAIY
ncbi:MAG: addiction module protein [Candidatus Cloacimonetes bacterium]|nr:addiction module protein [Candidatus Cloacimonadota bacterium]